MTPSPRSSLHAACSLIGVLLLHLSPHASAAEPTKSALATDPTGWTAILPPADLSGWIRVPYKAGAKITRQQWHVDNGILTCDGDGGHDMLLLNRQITNCIFHVEYSFIPVNKPKPGYNSGVWVRTLQDGSIWHQAQVSDDGGYLFGATPSPSGPRRFRIATQPCRVTPAGTWNTFEVTANGPKISLWVNGYVTAVLPDCGQPQGFIGLEGEGHHIQFRNLKLKILP